MDKTELEKLLNEGISLRKVGERLGCSLSTIRYWTTKYGLKSKHTQIINGVLYDREKVVAAVRNNVTVSGFLKEMGLDPRGSNYRSAKRAFARFEINTSHFIGSAARKGKSVGGGCRPLTAVLVDGGKTESHQTLKKRLLRENLLENKCYECEMGPEWRGKVLVLRLDHINGKPTDYRLENLRLLCPNCDSQTDTYCGRNIPKPADTEEHRQERAATKECQKKYLQEYQQKHPTPKNGQCHVCKTAITSGCIYCTKCYKSKRKVETRPDLETLQKEIKELGYRGTGRKYGVSDNSIRKWVRWAQNNRSSS